MRMLILGGGMMGRAAVYDMVRQDDVEEVIVADVDRAVAEDAARFAGSEKVLPQVLDVTDRDAVLGAMETVDAVLSAVSYRFNLELARLAIEAGVHFCDLGGNNTVVEGELALSRDAEEKGITLIPDCGLAPGMVSLLAMAGMNQLDTTDRVRLRVGGLPVHPEPPLDYTIVFSVHGLINEYIEPCLAIRDGKTVTIDPLTEVEEIEFPEPLGILEAFHTSGGSSTLPTTLLGKVRDLDYKTIRYPGHVAKMKAMLEIGLASEVPVNVGAVSVAPRGILETCLEKNLSGDDDDLVVLRVTIEGTKDGDHAVAVYEMIDYADSKTGLSAMMRGTSFPASIITLMMARGETPAGAIPQELAVDSERFIEEFLKRDMPLTVSLATP
jgi:lysine 6-dehydrogenase